LGANTSSIKQKIRANLCEAGLGLWMSINLLRLFEIRRHHQCEDMPDGWIPLKDLK
jgi:hypothetical protein